MAKEQNIVQYTIEEIKAMIARGEDETDWAKVRATTEAEIEAQAAEDDADFPANLPEGWLESQTIMGLPPKKLPVNLRLDADILDWFKQTGKGYQTRINNVLRAFVESRRNTG
jgi:uncharacterized protein (DUF4415 family)